MPKILVACQSKIVQVADGRSSTASSTIESDKTVFCLNFS